MARKTPFIASLFPDTYAEFTPYRDSKKVCVDIACTPCAETRDSSKTILRHEVVYAKYFCPL